MLLSDFDNEINYWIVWVQNQNEKDRRYDIALFKIWIIFEKYLTDMILVYSCGQISEKGYVPNQKLKFIDGSHFNSFFESKNGAYVDYIDAIERHSHHIFIDNPFQIIISDSSYSNYYKQMRVIRNYVAHESKESRSRYIREFCGNNPSNFIEPNDLLSKINKHKSKSYFSVYVEAIKDIANYINDPYF